MDAFALLLSLFIVDSLAIVSPGPNVLLVTQAAMERSRRQALFVALGMASGGLAWAGLAASGLSAVFEVLPSLQTAIRVAGALYLIWLGVRLWRASARATTAAPADAPSSGLARHPFVRGFVTSALNPKALAYFASIFVVLVPADTPAWLRAASIALVFVDALLWYGLAALLFSTPRVVRGYAALRRPIDRACALFMTAFGIRLMV
jgi:threonine/homoserine/homoserine lactone efflux protein